MTERFQLGRGVLELVAGDITREETEAIANAANGGLLGGGGVDGAIHRAAGPELLDACRQLKRSLPGGRLRTGGAVLTLGFRLKARYVIHCVGPVYSPSNQEAPLLLASCYREALRLCREQGIRSIAFPSISTGVYGYPTDLAAPIALAAVRDALEASALPEVVRFVLFDSATFDVYRHAAKS